MKVYFTQVFKAEVGEHLQARKLPTEPSLFQVDLDAANYLHKEHINDLEDWETSSFKGNVPHLFEGNVSGKILDIRSNAAIKEIFDWSDSTDPEEARDNYELEAYEIESYAIGDTRAARKFMNHPMTKLIIKKGYSAIKIMGMDPRNYNKDIPIILVFNPSKSVKGAKALMNGRVIVDEKNKRQLNEEYERLDRI